jgi:hypothetical protein
MSFLFAGLYLSWCNNNECLANSMCLVTIQFSWYLAGRRACRYQRSNQNPYIEEEQTTQWPKEKVQKDKQRSTKHAHKTKDRVTRTRLKTYTPTQMAVYQVGYWIKCPQWITWSHHFANCMVSALG